MLTYVRVGIFKELSNQKLRQLGAEIEFYEGLPEFFKKIRDRISSNPIFQTHEVRIEHYIVSTGLKAMIEGSKIAWFVDGIWASEFAEGTAAPGYLDRSQPSLLEGGPQICEIAYALDNSSKTRALFEINKGTNKMSAIDVNATIPPESRRIPFQNMIYVADGPSDIPSFSVINRFHGKTFAVYKPKSAAEFRKAYDLQKQHRVEAFGEANYTDGSTASMWITQAVEEIADRIVRDRTRALGDKLGLPPTHVIEPSSKVYEALRSEAGDGTTKKGPVGTHAVQSGITLSLEAQSR